MKFKVPRVITRRTDGDANADRTEINEESNRENRGSIEKPFKVLEEATVSRPMAEPPPPPVAKETRPLTFVEKLKIFGRHRKVSCRIFLVLMWKHGLVRLKRFIVTPLEFIIPGFFFVLLFLFSIIFVPGDLNKLMVETTKPLHHLSNPCLVLYTPENDFTRSLMSKAGHEMNLEPLMFLPNSTSRGYYGFSNYSKSIVNLINQLNSESALVIFNFQNKNGDVPFPDKLHYTIRIRGNHTENEMANDHPQSRNLPSWFTHLEEHETSSTNMVPELYMRIQWAIDASFILLRAENEVVFVYQYLQDKDREMVVLYMVVLTYIIALIALILPFAILMATLMSERYSGIQELMKQAGVSYSVWACSHFTNTVFTGLFFAIIGTLVLFCNPNKHMNLYTNFFFMLFALWLYFHSIMSFAFPLSFVVKSNDYAAIIAFAFYILISVPSFFLQGQYHTMLLLVMGLLPHIPFKWFFTEFILLEIKSDGMGFRNFSQSHSKGTMSALVAYLYMIIQIILNMLLAEYLSNVAPGKYGVRKPLNYLCKKEQKAAAYVLKETEEEKRERDQRYFEDTQRAPSDVGIYVDHVTKVFGKDVALANVAFPVYKGEITLLLGHNGAGKTTIMSIITGMMSATRGRILLDGRDVSQNRFSVQNSVGFCPQHNLFFQYLTCREHVRFYAMLKGVSFRQAKLDATRLLRQLGLQEKSATRAATLSGGQKRRLQLACALTGKSKILVLDEPTAGLDVETRRELWDILASLRGSRTVLLSTHMMDEADALGDRVVALHKGRLKAHATPMYLKKNIGSGYRLSFTTEGFPKTEEITAAVQSVIPSATLKESSYNSVSYNLPAQDSPKFAQLFTKLEGERDQLKIQTLGVGVSSLEEVFLKLCSDVDTQFTDEKDTDKKRETQYMKTKGCLLYLRQVRELLKRHFRYIKCNKYTFFFFQVLLPIVITGCIIRFMIHPERSQKSISRLSNTNENKAKPSVLYQANQPVTDDVIKEARSVYDDVYFRSTKSVTEGIRQAADNRLLNGSQSRHLNKYVVGVDHNDTHAKLYYSNHGKDAAPVALNLLSNILASKRLASAYGKTITTHIQPLQTPTLNVPKGSVFLFPPFFLLLGFFFFTVMFCVAILTTEQESGARQIHLMSGCPPAVIWLTTLFFHTVLYTVIYIIPITLLLLLDEGIQTSYRVAFFVILFVSLLTALVFFYTLSFCLPKSKFGIYLFVIIFVAGLVPGSIKATIHDYSIWLMIFKIYANAFYYICPVATTTVAIFRANHVAWLNTLCNMNLHLCPDTLPLLGLAIKHQHDYKGFDGAKCCAEGKGVMPYISKESASAGPAMLILLVHFIVFSILVLLLQYGIFNGLKDRIFNAKYVPLPKRFNNQHVKAEESYVEEQLQDVEELKSNEGADALLVNDLHKKYPKLCNSINAVRGIDFSVKKGECFGLLGVNGAGKSSTFKMIVAEEVSTRGSIFANGHFLTWPRSTKYMKSLGYCPQFSGLDEFMTGKQNLNLVLVLRGLSDKDVNTETEAWIQVVGLEKYRNILVGNYSGGCKRRLATACSLSSGGAVTLLDEPTAGVDVSARRRVWVALKKGLRSDRSVVITSHSMDEMEALCNRIAIMAAGEIGAFGSVPQLRAEHASGHALNIKTSHGGHVKVEDIQNLKDAIQQTFGCSLKDEHGSMLHYHIIQTMHYSELFTKLEALKQDHPVMEDYSITETTLEEVFLSFAKPQQKDNKNRRKREKGPGNMKVANKNSN